jgi:hypothetical protein
MHSPGSIAGNIPIFSICNRFASSIPSTFMLNMAAQSSYPLMKDEADVGNESDTTAYSEQSLERKKLSSRRHRRASRSAPSRSPRSQSYLIWLRWATIVALQSVIIVVLVRHPGNPRQLGTSGEVETGGDINGLYPTRTFLFQPSFPSSHSPSLQSPTHTSISNPKKTSTCRT